MKKVQLTPGEIFMATCIGAARRLQQSSSTKTKDWTGDLWNNDIEAARAECAVAKALGVYWSGSVGDCKVPDVGRNLQVRGSISDPIDPQGVISLIVRPDHDKDHMGDAFVLVYGRAGRYVIAGWLWGTEVAIPRYSKDPGGRGAAWFAPMEDLRPYEELERMFHEKHTASH